MKKKLIILFLLGISNLNINAIRNQELIEATKKGNLKAVKELIKSGVEIDATDKWGDTALIIAAKTCNKNIIKELIKAKANKKIKNNFGSNAFDLAFSYCTHKLVDYSEILDLLRPTE